MEAKLNYQFLYSKSDQIRPKSLDLLYNLYLNHLRIRLQ